MMNSNWEKEKTGIVADRLGRDNHHFLMNGWLTLYSDYLKAPGRASTEVYSRT
jgi:hypothetical protein